MTDGESGVVADGPAWHRFMLRLTAIAWPVLTYWFLATTRSSPVPNGSATRCAPLILELLLPVLTVLGVVALVCAANMVGHRKRYALAIAATTATAWIVIAVVVRSVASSTTCGPIF